MKSVFVKKGVSVLLAFVLAVGLVTPALAADDVDWNADVDEVDVNEGEAYISEDKNNTYNDDSENIDDAEKTAEDEQLEPDVQFESDVDEKDAIDSEINTDISEYASQYIDPYEYGNHPDDTTLGDFMCVPWITGLLQVQYIDSGTIMTEYDYLAYFMMEVLGNSDADTNNILSQVLSNGAGDAYNGYTGLTSDYKNIIDQEVRLGYEYYCENYLNSGMWYVVDAGLWNPYNGWTVDNETFYEGTDWTYRYSWFQHAIYFYDCMMDDDEYCDYHSKYSTGISISDSGEITVTNNYSIEDQYGWYLEYCLEGIGEETGTGTVYSDYEEFGQNVQLVIMDTSKITESQMWQLNYAGVKIVDINAVIPAEIDFAVYSESSTSTEKALEFFKDVGYPAAVEGNEYGGYAITDVFTGFDTTSYNSAEEVPWYKYRNDITAVDTTQTDIINSQIERDPIFYPASMAYWFYDFTVCYSFRLDNIDTSNVESMSHTFYNCSYWQNFNTISGSHGYVYLNKNIFDTSNVTDMSHMFDGCSRVASMDLSFFDTSKVTNMEGMFANCSKIEDLNIFSFDTSSVTSMASMFSGCTTIPWLSLAGFETSNVIDMSHMFENCSSLTSINVSWFDTIKVTDMSYMFNKSSSLTTIYSNDENFVTTNVQNSDDMFYGCSSLVGGNGTKYSVSYITSARAHCDVSGNAGYFTYSENIPFAIYSSDDKSMDIYTADSVPVIGDEYNGKITEAVYEINPAGYSSYSFVPWNQIRGSVTSVEIHNEIAPTSTAYWFYGFSSCTGITGLGELNMENVTSITRMFYNCSKAETLKGIDKWKITDNLTDLSYAFSGCSSVVDDEWTDTSFASGWDTSNVTTLYSTFNGCSTLKSANGLGEWNTGNVTELYSTFSGCSGLTDISALGKWGTTKNTTLYHTFNGCSSLTSMEAIEKWDVSNVTTLEDTFYGCSSLISLDLSDWDTENVTSLKETFSACSSLQYLNVSTWDTEQVTNIQQTFNNCSSLTELDVNNWNVTNVSSRMDTAGVINGGPFMNCSSLKELDLSNWQLPNLTDLTGMFRGCSSLETIHLDNLDTSKITNIRYMFCNCSSLKNIIGLESFDTGAVTNMSYLFSGCTGLTELDLTSWDTESLENTERMFSNCSSLITIYASDLFKTDNITNSSNMFYGCELIEGSNGTTYDSSKVSKSMAHIDVEENPGYFSCNHEYSAAITEWNENEPTNLTDDTFELALVCNKCKHTLTFTQDDTDYVEYSTDSKINCTEDTTVKFSVSITYNDETYPISGGEEYTVTAEGHKFSDESGIARWTWDTTTNPDEPTCTLTTICTVCNEEFKADCSIAEIADTRIDPTCETDGSVECMATAFMDTGVKNDDGSEKIQALTEVNKVTLYATGHNYVLDKDATQWIKSYASTSDMICDMMLKCTHEGCNSTYEINDCTVTEETTPVTCTTDGKTVYTATGYCNYNGETYTDTMETVTPATGHDYDYENAVIDFMYDVSNGKALVTVTCKNCGEIYSYEVDVEYEVVYTYDNTNDEYNQETKTTTMSVKITDPDSGITYTFWNEEDAVETFGRHDWIIDVISADPTCTVDGHTVYVCSTCGITMTETLKAYGHDWDIDMYSNINPNGVTHMWSMNYQSCVFTFTCLRCGGRESISAEVTSTSANGSTTYTASCVFGGKTFSTSVTVNALGQTVEGDLGTGTIGSNNSNNSDNGTGSTYNGALGDTTVGDARTTAKAQTDDSATASETSTSETSSGSGDGNSTVSGTTATNTNGTTTTETSATETGGVKTGERVGISALACAVLAMIGSACAGIVARKKKAEEN